MYFAQLNGERVEAAPGIRDATCPQCDALVIPKCGSQVVHHWAHVNREDCDTWSQPESKWHRGWKNAWPKAKQEVVLGAHRADILTATGVLEIQHSPISFEEIIEREAFYDSYSPYGNTAWLFDARDSYDADRLQLRRPKGRPGGTYRGFRWKHARKSVQACRGRVYLCLGDGDVFRIGAIYWNYDGSVTGWGHLIQEEGFMKELDLVRMPQPRPIVQYEDYFFAPEDPMDPPFCRPIRIEAGERVA